MHDEYLVPFMELRDGRQLKRERKPRNVMALSRFLQKKNGLYGQQESITLHELGMPELSPSHAHRPTWSFPELHVSDSFCVSCTGKLLILYFVIGGAVPRLFIRPAGAQSACCSHRIPLLL